VNCVETWPAWTTGCGVGHTCGIHSQTRISTVVVAPSGEDKKAAEEKK
jgi:hypothetical protein